MPNRSYCRFENTYHDLLDCEDHFGDREGDGEDGTLSPSEAKYRDKLVQLCSRITADWDG